ncbi:Man1-Src1p-C-terminal domain-containing protein [Gamsiella multidivaricata]|uniref:Man1-Src1p-C-terminal domain-containing protein n=1 Tax=Gamsiella multidivaricata TaxID=101098 RepID=UPI00221F4198|nr:Man1-Src1p-C-terminal domain-containing protein [Gamsiella multidivaricata]KAI7817056.1 Man1-Src1p-C-terminal domain-containing protein [Gamsiella multidivaricata]
MALSEPPHYLHPDFDPWKLKMDQIRDILIQHHVKTPTGIVRKQQLVDLFNQHIRPQVPEISEVEKDAELNDHENKASSSKTRHQLAKKEEEQTTAETAPPKSTRVKRASSKQRLDPEEPAEVKPKIERGSSRGKVSADRSDVESKTSVTGRGRKPRKTPVQSEDDSEPISKSLRVKREAKEKKKARSANFSDENPFQSGSESERKRSRSRSRTRKAKESDKRDHVFKVPAQPAFSKFMHTPLPEKGDPSKSSAHPKPRKIMPDEFPTPKPLHLNAPQSDMQDLLNNLRRNMGPIWLILSTVLLAYGIWYRQTRIDIGFCTEAELGTPTSRAWYYPSCIPCPDHATCLRSDTEPICPPEYILKPQLLSFGNLIPLSPVCVLNRAKEYQSLQVADAVEKMLHLHAGNIECSLSRDKAPLNSVEYRARRGISVNDLRSQLVQLKDDNVSDEDFGQYWDLALRELRRRSDRVIFEHGLTGEERVRSLRPQKSLGCRIRQALVSWVVKFRFFLFAMVASATGGFAIRSQVLKRRKEGRIVNGLVQNVLAKLSDQAHYHYVDPALFLDPFLPQTHLRDALLADVHSAARRQEIWDKVQAIVERNSNVRTSSQEVHGELHRVWEWVGPSGVLSQHGAGEAISQVDNLNHGVMSGSTRGRGVPKVPPRTGPHGSFFGLRRQDSEFLNPENSLYPSLSQDYQGYTQE